MYIRMLRDLLDKPIDQLYHTVSKGERSVETPKIFKIHPRKIFLMSIGRRDSSLRELLSTLKKSSNYKVDRFYQPKGDREKNAKIE